MRWLIREARWEYMLLNARLVFGFDSLQSFGLLDHIRFERIIRYAPRITYLVRSTFAVLSLKWHTSRVQSLQQQDRNSRTYLHPHTAHQNDTASTPANQNIHWDHSYPQTLRINTPHHPFKMAPLSTTMHHLLKREDANMGFLFPPAVITLLICLGAGFLVCVGYAIHSAFGFGPDNNRIKPLSAEQMEYMTEVRVRNMMALEFEGRKAWEAGRAARSGPSGRREGEVVYD